MTASARPLLSHLLIGMVLIGHAPAWLHVAGVLHPHAVAPHAVAPHAVALTEKAIASEPVHSCCCHHHDHSPPATSTEESERQSGESSNPDHAPCVLCQSLAGTVGVVIDQAGCELVVPLIRAPLSLDTPRLAEIWFSIAQPRGPPQMIA